jgi:glycosyltransferase involved in cell wall biosynthesis
MQPINLLYVITKLELGGAQTQVLSLIRHLDKGKFRLFLFTSKGGFLVAEALAINNLTVYTSTWLERPINPFKDLLALIEIYRFIKKNNIEIVHTHSSKAGILGRLAAQLAKITAGGKKSLTTTARRNSVRKIVHTVHGWSFNEYQSSLARGLYIFLERFVGRFTDTLIVVSDWDKRKGLENKIGKDDTYALIRYGINFDEFQVRARSLKQDLGMDVDDLVVGMIACFKPQKAPQDFIKVAASVHKILPEVKFLLVGDGVLRKDIERLIYAYNLQTRVILTGWRQDIPGILSVIDVFVLTSLWEGLPISVLEAMASSKPVIATHTGGVTEVLAEGRGGFIVPAHDTGAMTDRLVSVLKNETLRNQMGQNARAALPAGFRLEHMVAQTGKLYCDVM